MTPRQVVEKYGTRLIGIAAVAFVALGFNVLSPSDKLASLEARTTALEHASERQQSLLQGIARMQCMAEPERARLAGLPCHSLLDGAR